VYIYGSVGLLLVWLLSGLSTAILQKLIGKQPV